MNGSNVITIPLYNKEQLVATGYRQGCGYNTKIFWGSELLASAPSLLGSIGNAYVGVRLYSPKYHEWMTPDERVKILKALTEMSNLIDPKLIYKNNDGLIKNLTKVGLKWSLDNKVVIKLDENEPNVAAVVTMLREGFLKAAKLCVHIRLVNEFNEDPSKDLFETTLAEETPGKRLAMGISERFLPASEFGAEWIKKATQSFNEFRRVSSLPEVFDGSFGAQNGTLQMRVVEGSSGMTNHLHHGVVNGLKTGNADIPLGNTLSRGVGKEHVPGRNMPLGIKDDSNPENTTQRMLGEVLDEPLSSRILQEVVNAPPMQCHRRSATETRLPENVPGTIEEYDRLKVGERDSLGRIFGGHMTVEQAEKLKADVDRINKVSVNVTAGVLTVDAPSITLTSDSNAIQIMADPTLPPNQYK